MDFPPLRWVRRVRWLRGVHVARVLRMWVVLLGLLALCGVAPARTITVDFDDVTDTEPDCDPNFVTVAGRACTRVNGPYVDYLWDNARIVNGCFYDPAEGYCRGTLSPSNVMISERRGTVKIHKAGGETFSFYGASVALARARFSRSDVFFSGFRRGIRVFQVGRSLGAARQDFPVTFENVDEVQMTSTRSIAYDNVRLGEFLCRTPGLHFNLTSPALLGNRIYQAYADFDGCSGSLTATAIDPSNGEYGAPQWDAACTLSGPGPACNRIAPALHPSAAPDYLQRSLVTLNPSGGPVLPLLDRRGGSQFAFEPDPTWGSLRWLQYIGGNRSDEAQPAALAMPGGGQSDPGVVFRPRSSRLGDIVQSSPVAVGAPGADWTHVRIDALTGADLRSEVLAYRAFQTAHAARVPMVYVGANDGFLHGFQAVAPGGTQPDDGAELLAYAPAVARHTLWSPNNPDFSLAAHGYDHQFFVDATVGVADAYVDGAWKTLLMGGLGAGGNAAGPVRRDSATARGVLYVLDVTDPAGFGVSGRRVRRPVAQEVHSGPGLGTVRCSRFDRGGPVAQACAEHLGAQYGTPQLRRMHNGRWAMIAGNGLYSASGRAGIFVFTRMDQLGGTDNYFLDSSAAVVAGRKNGVVQVTPVDLDDDGVVDYIYAGDVLGNVWRFDVTSARPQDWLSTAPVLVYSTPNRQPISTRLLVNVQQSDAGQRVVVQFGTGRAWPLLSASGHGNDYATDPQAIYGIWDWHFSAWNALSNRRYRALVVAPNEAEVVARRLAPDQVVDGRTYRSLEPGPVCWIGDSGFQGCSNYMALGWRLELPAIGNTNFHEQVVFEPQLVNGLMVVNTLAPGWPLATSRGFTMTIGADGAAPKKTFFSDVSHVSQVVGAELQGLGTAVFYTDTSSQTRMYQKNAAQESTVTKVELPVLDVLTLRRLTWRNVR